MPFANINGARLFYTDEGSGPAIVLAHGTTCDSNDWNMQLPAFESDFRVISVDLRGHGLSSSPDGNYSSHQDAADLAALVTDLGLERVVAFGHSTGGACAVSFAVSHPALVRAVVAVDPSYGMDPASQAALRGALDAMTDESTHDIFRASFVDFYAETSPRYLRLWHARRLQGVEPWVLRACYRDTALAEDQIFFRPEAERFLGRVPCPVFTLRRTGSSIAPSSADWDCSLFSHPYSTGISWSGAGHWPHQERPEEFNVAVTSWIRGLPAPGFTSP